MENEILMSNHACQRAQQRGIRPGLIQNIIEHHDRESEVGDDCRVLRVSRRAARDFARSGGDRQMAERLPTVAVIWSDRNAQVVTIIHDGGGRDARRYRVRG